MPNYERLSAEIAEKIALRQASPYAFADKNAIRRDNMHDKPDAVRTPFIRDCDKILHCPFYNRYTDKTQVFSFYKNDDISRRALHVQLVSRIARTIGKALGLNLELIEAIALGHDIGHTPFGHAGESFLDEVYFEHTGRHFAHNIHSVRVLDRIFPYNITLQTLKRLKHYLPDNYEKDYKTICQPLDFYCQNIYKGFLYKKGIDGRPELVPFDKDYPYTVIGWPITPKSLYWGPKFLYERYKLPFVITENGISCFDKVCCDGKVHDNDRIKFMNDYIHELYKAKKDGVDAVGYFAWSLMDNFEWAEGYDHRFGLIYVDYDNLKRIPKDSYYWYRNLINGGP